MLDLSFLFLVCSCRRSFSRAACSLLRIIVLELADDDNFTPFSQFPRSSSFGSLVMRPRFQASGACSSCQMLLKIVISSWHLLQFNRVLL